MRVPVPLRFVRGAAYCLKYDGYFSRQGSLRSDFHGNETIRRPARILQRGTRLKM